ncbi:hypothetical protein PsorP6_010569 [Peronosclerospora sorghi]|uniref:Uncharacterized protein n=1 Tax=Peronosclerospora sorghi TaxID=230839 RepID=A0ACC0VYM7_9STRA|nr:hypothetical protein PsorP6_010569 [Peronosclerospora sorghi]
MVTNAVLVPWYRQQFVTFALDLYDIVTNTMHEISTWNTLKSYTSSLPRLVDNVFSLIYGRTNFSLLRNEVSSLLLDRQVPGSISDTLNQMLRAFIVQLEEFGIASTVRHRHIWDGMGSNCMMQSDWNRRWILTPGSISLNAIENGVTRDVRLDATVVLVAQLVREVGGIEITVSGRDPLCMAVRSMLSFDDAMKMAPMELILDGQLRGFRVLPSGIASVLTTVGGWPIGDYEAIVSNDGQCLVIHFFAFSERDMTKSVFNKNNQTERHTNAHTTVRKASLSLVLEQASGTLKSKDSISTSGHSIVVGGTVFDSTYCRANSLINTSAQLSAMSTSDRKAIWSELTWTPRFEVHANYIALRM